MGSVALIWPTGANTVSQLDLLPGDTTRLSYPYASSASGAVIVGYAFDGSDIQPVRWDGLSVSQLAPITGVRKAVWCSQDAQIILGTGNFSPTDIARWTGGGAAGGFLTTLSGSTGSRLSTTLLDLSQRWSSDDGTVIVGRSIGGTDGATIWTNDVPVAIPGTVIGATCSANGDVVSGLDTSNYASFWDGAVLRPLDIAYGDPSPAPYLIGMTTFCDGPGNVIYGTVGLPGPVYWDNLGFHSTNVFGTFYGNIHIMDNLPIDTDNLGSTINYVAETNNIAVGYGHDATHRPRAVKWVGTVATQLSDYGFSSMANGCSADGSIVVGFAFDADGFEWPVYWDAVNVLHRLPTIADLTDTTQGNALGISRDGSLIWGIGDTPTVPAPPTPFCGDLHTTSSFTAAWSAVSGATSYTVDYRMVGDVSFTEITGITATSVLITGLLPGIAYEFKVKAVNGGGEGDFSDLVECSTTLAGTRFLICGPDWTITQPQTKVYGLEHLAGKVVTGLVDGVVLDPVIVNDDGSVDLPFPASSIKIGLGFPVQVQTPYLDAGNPTIQGRRKDILAITVRVDSSAVPDLGTNQPDGGAQIPQSINPPWVGMLPGVTQEPNLQPETYVGPSGQLTTKLFTGDFRANVQPGWNEKGQVAVQQTKPVPLSVTAVVPETLEGDLPEQTYSDRRSGESQQQPRPPGIWMLR